MSASSVMAIGIVRMEMTRPLHCARVSQYIIYGCWTPLSFVSISDWTTDKCLLPHYGGCFGTRECISSEFDVTCGACLDGFNDLSGLCAGKLYNYRNVQTMCMEM